MAFTKENAKENAKKSNRKGIKNKSTIVKEAIGIKNIEDLKDKVLEVWNELLLSKNEDNRKFASKEISKYVFPQKRDITANITSHDEFIKKFGDVL